MKDKIAVLITTEWRGVLFTYIDPDDKCKKDMEIGENRFCVYWSADMKGLLGLCTKGPSASCKIGPKVPWGVINQITGVFPVTPEAAKAWEKAPWG